MYINLSFLLYLFYYKICNFYFQAILREQESGELTQAEVTVENQVSSFLRNVRQNLVRQNLVRQNLVRQNLVRQNLVRQNLVRKK
jgi:hypothetical protein